MQPSVWFLYWMHNVWCYGNLEFLSIAFLDRARGSGFETTLTRGLSIAGMFLLSCHLKKRKPECFQNSIFDKNEMMDNIQNIRQTDCYTPSLEKCWVSVTFLFFTVTTVMVATTRAAAATPLSSDIFFFFSSLCYCLINSTVPHYKLSLNNR